MSKVEKVDVFEEINVKAIDVAYYLCQRKGLLFIESDIVKASEYQKDEDKYLIIAEDQKTGKYSSWYLSIEEGNEQLLCKSIDYESRLECYKAMLERICVVVNNETINQEYIEERKNSDLRITQEEAKTLNFFLWWARKRSDRELNACHELINMFKEENPNLSLKLESDKEFLIEMNATVDEIIPKIAKIAYQNQEEEQ